TENRRNAKRRKYSGIHLAGMHPHRLTRAGKLIGDSRIAAEALEAVSVSNICADFGCGHRNETTVPRVGSLEPASQRNKTTRIRERQWTEQDALDDGEGGGRRGNAKRQHKGSCNGKSW